jgi:hypothetical protein
VHAAMRRVEQLVPERMRALEQLVPRAVRRVEQLVPRRVWSMERLLRGGSLWPRSRMGRQVGGQAMAREGAAVSPVTVASAMITTTTAIMTTIMIMNPRRS